MHVLFFFLKSFLLAALFSDKRNKRDIPSFILFRLPCACVTHNRLIRTIPNSKPSSYAVVSTNIERGLLAAWFLASRIVLPSDFLHDILISDNGEILSGGYHLFPPQYLHHPPPPALWRVPPPYNIHSSLSVAYACTLLKALTKTQHTISLTLSLPQTTNTTQLRKRKEK